MTLQTEKSNLRTSWDDDGGAGDELRQQNMEGERRTKRWKVMSLRVSNWLGCKMFFFFFFLISGFVFLLSLSFFKTLLDLNSYDF